VDKNIKELITFIGDDPNREGLLETPRRVLSSYCELFSGYTWTDELIDEMLSKTFTDINNYDEIITCKNIEFVSFCEHHILPFTGIIHVGYLPNKKVIGLSKIPRLVDIYSKRLQIQERLTKQIADKFNEVIKPLGVGVIIEAKHMCVSCRGVKKENSTMITSAMLGEFTNNHSLKEEFLKLIYK